MRIVVDTNILYACLQKDGLRRKIFLSYQGMFFAPEYLLEELEVHRERIQRQGRLDDAEFERLLSLFMEKIFLVREERLLSAIGRAIAVVRPIDIDDAAFIACALATKGVLWSDDAALKRQTAVRVLNTEEMLKKFSQ